MTPRAILPTHLRCTIFGCQEPRRAGHSPCRCEAHKPRALARQRAARRYTAIGLKTQRYVAALDEREIARAKRSVRQPGSVTATVDAMVARVNAMVTM